MAVSADGLTAGTGYYQLSRDQLARFREGVLDEAGGAALQAALDAADAAGLEVGAPALTGTPRGVPRDHPRADLLRFTNMIVWALAPDGAMESRAAVGFARRVASDARPVTDWLDAHVGSGRSAVRPRTPPGGSGRGRRPV